MSQQTLAEKLANSPQTTVKFMSDIALATIFALSRVEAQHSLRHLLGADKDMSPDRAVERTIEGVRHLLQPFQRAYGPELWAAIWSEVQEDLVEGLSGIALALKSTDGFGEGTN